MRANITFLSMSIAAALLGWPSYADDTNSAMAVKHQNILLPSDTTIAFSVANLPKQLNSLNQAKTCDSMNGFIRFSGTGTTEVDVTLDSLDGDKTPGFQPRQTRVLDNIPFNLAPGEVLPLEFKQPFGTAQTITIETAVAPNVKHCLVSSSTAVHRSSSGDFLSFLPATQTVPSFSESLSAFDSEPLTCCACVPVCGCGFC